jgi:hypothetical protein
MNIIAKARKNALFVVGFEVDDINEFDFTVFLAGIVTAFKQ